MSKTYLLLIGGLVILALAIGGYAFYKSTPRLPTYTQPSTNYPNQPAAPTKNQITLTVTTPQNGAQVATPTITVIGKTVANADVSINDADLKADAAGNFTTTIALEEGDNYVSVTAVDDSGQVAEQEITVTYTPAN